MTNVIGSKKPKPNLADVMERLAKVEAWMADNQPSSAEIDARKKDRANAEHSRRVSDLRVSTDGSQKRRDEAEADVVKAGFDVHVKIDDATERAKLLDLLGISEQDFHTACRTGQLRVQERQMPYRFVYRYAVAGFLLSLRREREGATA